MIVELILVICVLLFMLVCICSSMSGLQNVEETDEYGRGLTMKGREEYV